MVSGGIGLAILGYGFIRKVLNWSHFHLLREHGPLMALGAILLVAGLLFLMTGLIGDLLMRVYFESTRARTYAIRRIVTQKATKKGEKIK